MSPDELDRPPILRKAQDEFHEKPIQSSGVLVGILTAFVATVAAAWTVRSTLTIYILPTVYWVLVNGYAVYLVWRSRDFSQTGLTITLAGTVMIAFIGMVMLGAVSEPIGMKNMELRLLALIPTTAEVTAREMEIPIEMASWKYWTTLVAIHLERV
ncbi:MAG: hypothetical protein IID42_02650 [Planctomycetes bacterium]|nr:hypothetical protein [Planctomycetota bacterium]